MPLETPRPLPAAFHAMAAAITGGSTPPRYTTGPATRHALAAAGALGATTGAVVHLPAAPSGDAGSRAVLAHELSHARRPVRRPRFLLASGGGHVDDDEREAQAMGAGIVGSLPVGGPGGGAGVAEVATRAARAAVIEATGMPGMPGIAGVPGLPGMPGVPGMAGMATTGASVAVQEERQQSAPEVAPNSPQRQAAPTSEALDGPGSGAAGGIDVDRVVEAVEERLLREIERRGGRWAGVF